MTFKSFSRKLPALSAFAAVQRLYSNAVSRMDQTGVDALRRITIHWYSRLATHSYVTAWIIEVHLSSIARV